MPITAAIAANEQASATQPGRARVVFPTEGARSGPTYANQVERRLAVPA